MLNSKLNKIFHNYENHRFVFLKSVLYINGSAKKVRGKKLERQKPGCRCLAFHLLIFHLFVFVFSASGAAAASAAAAATASDTMTAATNAETSISATTAAAEEEREEAAASAEAVVAAAAVAALAEAAEAPASKSIEGDFHHQGFLFSTASSLSR